MKSHNENLQSKNNFAYWRSKEKKKKLKQNIKPF